MSEKFDCPWFSEKSLIWLKPDEIGGDFAECAAQN